VLAEARHAWRGHDVLDGGEPREEPVSWLDRRSVLAVCAIGKPRSVFEACERAGATVTHRVELRDHDPYAETTIRRILHSARDHAVGAIVTTAKDWVKLRRVRPGVWPAPIARPRLSLDFESGEADLHSLVLLAAETDPDEPAVVWHGSRPTGPTHDRFL